MDNHECDCSTLRVLFGSCLSEINTHILILYYGTTLPENKSCSLSSLLFLTNNKLYIR